MVLGHEAGERGLIPIGREADSQVGHGRVGDRQVRHVRYIPETVEVSQPRHVVRLLRGHTLVAWATDRRQVAAYTLSWRSTTSWPMAGARGLDPKAGDVFSFQTRSCDGAKTVRTKSKIDVSINRQRTRQLPRIT